MSVKVYETCECDGCGYSGACYGGTPKGGDGLEHLCMIERNKKHTKMEMVLEFIEKELLTPEQLKEVAAKVLELNKDRPIVEMYPAGG